MGAGNSVAASWLATLKPVYPRGCGELDFAQILSQLGGGLSPWVRGTLEQIDGMFSVDRFIPVGAGNSPGTPTDVITLAVYPRGCGELESSTVEPFFVSGLSPWVRGTRFSNT